LGHGGVLLSRRIEPFNNIRRKCRPIVPILTNYFSEVKGGMGSMGINDTLGAGLSQYKKLFENFANIY